MTSIDKMRSAGISNTEISGIWHIPPIISTAAPSTGTIHQITLLSTNEGNYVSRAYHYTQKDCVRIVHEHATSAYVQAHGLPAVAPLFLPSGETILEHEGRFYRAAP